jgi:tRNA (guanine-N7-)-methyltransferase
MAKFATELRTFLLSAQVRNLIFAPMPRRKQLKKDGFNTLPNCVNADPAIRGQWATHFGNAQPLVLEVGCGKGDLSIGLAARHPEQNFIGMDIKAVRMWFGGNAALRRDLHNVAFLRCNAGALQDFFAPGELQDIWITFPDPFPKKKQTHRRLTNEMFLRVFAQLLPEDGRIYFKSDNLTLFDYTLAHFAELNDKGIFNITIHVVTRDLHNDPLGLTELGTTTEYERRFLEMGKPIHYMCFSLKAGVNVGLVPATEDVGLDLDEKAPRGR